MSTSRGERWRQWGLSAVLVTGLIATGQALAWAQEPPPIPAEEDEPSAEPPPLPPPTPGRPVSPSGPPPPYPPPPYPPLYEQPYGPGVPYGRYRYRYGFRPLRPRRDPLRDRMYLQLQIGGGSYDEILDNLTSSGVTWNVSVGVELMRQIFAMEARYLGAAMSFRSSAETLLASGIAGVVRFNLWNGMVRPFVLAGLGYMALDSTGPAATVVLVRGQRVTRAFDLEVEASGAVVPLGGGVQFLVSPDVGLGVEGTYNFLVGRDFSDDFQDGFGLWSVTGTVQLRFF